MNASELDNYLQREWIGLLPFSPEEISEPLLTAYNIVKWAVRDQCTVIEVSPQQVIWKRIGTETVGEFPTPINFKPYFQLIVDRDPMLRTHLKLIEETETSAKYHIV